MVIRMYSWSEIAGHFPPCEVQVMLIGRGYLSAASEARCKFDCYVMCTCGHTALKVGHVYQLVVRCVNVPTDGE